MQESDVDTLGEWLAQWLTIVEAAKRLGVSRTAVYCAIGRRRIATVEIGGRLMVSAFDIEEYRQRRFARANRRSAGEAGV